MTAGARSAAAGRCAARDRRHRRAAGRRATDLSAVALDLDGVPTLDRRVYAIARTIACGATRSYGEIAVELGERSLARDVGQALGRNPFPLIVPCHRVLAAGGKIGGFSANGGVTTKLRLLTIERARTSDAPRFSTVTASASQSSRRRGLAERQRRL